MIRKLLFEQKIQANISIFFDQKSSEETPYFYIEI